MKHKPLTKKKKRIAMILLTIMFFDVCSPLSALALTGGPSQPEVQSFEPVGTSEMVDVFSGDFTYNIPLLDVNGYPINISYHAGISADQEASWVGLGWNINPGTINRGLNGLPDDMNGEVVKKTLTMKDNWTMGVNVGVGIELFGKDLKEKLGKSFKDFQTWKAENRAKRANGQKTDLPKANLSFNLGVKYNSYKGWGYTYGTSYSRDVLKSVGLNSGLSVGYSDDGGISISPSVSLSRGKNEENALSGQRFDVGSSFNSRSGMHSVNVGMKDADRVKNSNGKESGQRRQRAQMMYTFGSSMYTPNISTPYSGYGIDFNFNAGSELFGVEGEWTFTGSFSNQYIANSDKHISKPGYGYLYEQEADQGQLASERDHLLDFSRHNDLPLMESTPYLPWANHAHDMYSVSAQGVGGNYRLFRNEISVVHDDYRASNNNGFRAGYEVATGNAVKAGINFGFNHSGSKSGMWDENNGLLSKIGPVNNKVQQVDFLDSGNYDTHYYADNVDYEPAFFREVNELVPQNENFLDVIDREDNLYPKVAAINSTDAFGRLKPRHARVYSTLFKDNANVTLNSDKTENIGKERTTRNKLFTYLTGEDKNSCLSTMIQSYKQDTVYNDQGVLPFVNYDRALPYDLGYRKASHISEISIVNNDGSRHVFGIPAYNIKQIEKSFRVEEASYTDKQQGLVNYNNNDATVDNNVGIDQFFSRTETPGYAHSYLLTGVLSPDYVDLTGDGISDDDLGSAVKINYTLADENYKWRTPYQGNKAKYAEGQHSDATDGMGSVIYGEKELWYMHSIEGKTHVALFKISARQDALGVLDSNGGKDVMEVQYKLDSIMLFSKRDLLVNGTDAVPIKTVHFEYDYELCQNVPNQIGSEGKLTLQKIYFTYGNSRKGKLNAYKFNYDATNAQYHLQSYDMWGSYAPFSEEPSNGEYPYTTQNQTLADQYASMWNLTQIELPSGGVINVEYEADDYAYVQDKRAMSMLPITHFGRFKDGQSATSGFDTARALYGEGLDKDQYDIVFFDLRDDITSGDATEILRKEHLKDIQDIQMSVYVAIDGDNTNNYEYVKTYVKPARVYEESTGSWEIDCGVTHAGQTGWIRLEKRHLKDKEKGEKVNPVAIAAFQYARMNLNYLINRSQNSKQSAKNGKISVPLVSSFAGFLGEMASMAAGPNRMLMVRKYCRVFDPSRSWIRLNDADKDKIGGGHRVKQVTMSDQWSDINDSDGNAKSASYGQQYDYTKTESSETGVYSVISSGVATYEPAMGRDENPFVVPHHFDQKNPGVPDQRYTFEHPIGESFMPGASVGYSKVTVRSIDHNGQNPNHRTGYQESEFYTARDFPVQIKKSEIESVFSKPGFSFSFIYGQKFELATASQGYTVILNDMHGKPKSNFSYDEYGKVLSGAKYEYQTDSDGHLDNTALVIQPDGTIEEKTLGVNIDVTVDFQKKRDRVFSADADFNLDVFAAGVLPVFIPTLFPKVNFSETNVYTAVSTKVVRKIGLLKRTTALKEGSEIHTDNLLYDGKTGQVLLTSVGNEFDGDVFNFNYPAHWAYDRGMGQAFLNWGLEVQGLSLQDGILESVPVGLTLTDYFYPGDVCLFNRPGEAPNQEVHVVESFTSTRQNAPGNLCLVDGGGHLLSYDLSSAKDQFTSLRVIRSGRRNMASVSIGSVTTLQNPIQGTSGSYYLAFDQILATSAVEYKDEWHTELPFISGAECDTVVSDFFYAVRDGMNQIIDSARWQYNGELLIDTDLGTYFPDTTGTNAFGNRRMHWSNYDSCHQQIIVQYLDDLGYNLDSLVDSVFTYSDFIMAYDTLGNVSDREVGFKMVDPFAFDTDSLAETFEFTSIGYYPYVDIQTTLDNPSNEVVTLSLYHKDLIFGNLETCRNGNITPGAGNGSYGVIWDTIYQIDTNSSLASVENILNTKNERYTTTNDMLVIGNSQSYYLGFPNTECVVWVEGDLDNVTHFDTIIDFEVFDEKNAQVTAIVHRWDNTTYPNQDTLVTDTATYDLFSSCYSFLECQEFCYAYEYSERINPYRAGIRGNWRPYKSWTYVDDRDYNATGARPASDGTFSNYSPFWLRSGSVYEPTTSDDNWVWTSEVTEYSPYGMELENMDPLGRYSAAQYGYSQTLPTAVGSNMRHRQLWYEGFEEYLYLESIESRYICPQWHFEYDSTLAFMVANVETSTGRLDQTFSHSGNLSLSLGGGDSLIQEIIIDPEFDTSNITNLYGQEYFTTEDDQIKQFRPTAGEYVISAWVHQDGAPTDTLYDETVIVIEFEDNMGSLTSRDTFRAGGTIIHGWQRIQDTFSVPQSPYIMRVKYVTGSADGWYDDFRIHPFNGNMKSYAYDYRTLRLMAEMDENNYATFYEYDLEGNLVRVKKETQRGVKTLQENRQHQVITNP